MFRRPNDRQSSIQPSEEEIKNQLAELEKQAAEYIKKLQAFYLNIFTSSSKMTSAQNMHLFKDEVDNAYELKAKLAIIEQEIKQNSSLDTAHTNKVHQLHSQLNDAMDECFTMLDDDVYGQSMSQRLAPLNEYNDAFIINMMRDIIIIHHYHQYLMNEEKYKKQYKKIAPLIESLQQAIEKNKEQLSKEKLNPHQKRVVENAWKVYEDLIKSIEEHKQKFKQADETPSTMAKQSDTTGKQTPFITRTHIQKVVEDESENTLFRATDKPADEQSTPVKESFAEKKPLEENLANTLLKSTDKPRDKKENRLTKKSIKYAGKAGKKALDLYTTFTIPGVIGKQTYLATKKGAKYLNKKMDPLNKNNEKEATQAKQPKFGMKPKSSK